MKNWSIRAIVALAVAGCAGLAVARTKRSRRELVRGSDPLEQAGAPLADGNMESLATDEGMPEPA